MNPPTSSDIIADQTASGGDHITHEPGKSYAVIAKVELQFSGPSGEKAPISAAIGAPYITLDGFWRTPMRITGFGDPSPEVYGIDSLQALYNAIAKIRTELSLLAESGKLTDAKGGEFSLTEYLSLN